MREQKHENKRQFCDGERRPYERPRFDSIYLALNETLSSGCKLGTDTGCVGPPVQAFEGGS